MTGSSLKTVDCNITFYRAPFYILTRKTEKAGADPRVQHLARENPCWRWLLGSVFGATQKSRPVSR
jgi:hypothetical protein